MAFQALQRIGSLYAIEARQQLREEKSLAELEALHGWLVKTRTQTANGGGSAKALDYTISERVGQRAAAIQTLFGTAQLNGLNPSAWLKDTLIKLPTWPNSRIDELLPLPPAFIETLKHKN